VLEGQTDENVWYKNEGTEDLWEFMDFVGNRIALKDWPKFRGGLDTKSDCTGKESYFTEVRNGEYFRYSFLSS
tara:strand:- start:670 stop:888 length:219 start_codon:yes stop_codon:yes gene_type:complete